MLILYHHTKFSIPPNKILKSSLQNSQITEIKLKRMLLSPDADKSMNEI